MTKNNNYPIVVGRQKARVRMADGRVVDSWPPNQPLKPGAVQISEDEWQELRKERIAKEEQARREAEANGDIQRTPRELVMQAIGEASMCWSETPAGTFDAQRAIAIGERLLAELNANTNTNANANELADAPADQDAHGAEGGVEVGLSVAEAAPTRLPTAPE